MFCNNCGKELKDGAKFCSGCGAVVKQQPAPPVQQPAGQAPQYGQQAPPAQPAYQQPQAPAPTQQASAPQPAYQQAPPQPGQPVYQQPQAPAPTQQAPAPPPVYQQPQASAPQYGQQAPPPAQPAYKQPASAPKKKSRKPLIFAGVAAAVVLVIVLAASLGGGKGEGPGANNDRLEIDAFSDRPEGRPMPFQPIGGGFLSHDPSIAMIEINQGLSYGFDTDTGEFYLMENFVAGKETAIFVNLAEPLDPKSEAILTIEKNGETVATLLPAEMVSDTTILFQPRDMAEVGYWEEGAYMFKVDIDGKYAERPANFFKSIPLKILAVPIIGNFAGKIVPCEGEWRNGGQMLTDAYPVAKADVEYVLGPELDLSDPIYDLSSEDGMWYVWCALRDLQTPDEEYTLILGFVREGIKGGHVRGYTYGLPANIICEPDGDMLSVVLHEIAHCYKIGDEYPGGSLNDILNPPPYLMEGKDIITREPAAGTKVNVKGGFDIGYRESGSIIYPEQRPYRVGERQSLGTVTSYMGWATNCDPYDKWVTSDIWNHIFRAFTGQLTGHEPGFGKPEPGGGDGGDGGDPGDGGDGGDGGDPGNGGDGGDGGDPGDGGNGGDDPGDYWGQCYICFGSVYDPTLYVQCHNCFVYTSVPGEHFYCGGCGTEIDIRAEYTTQEFFLECSTCDGLMYFPDFFYYNTNSIESDRSEGDKQITVVRISGAFGQDGEFDADPWFTYQAAPGICTVNKDGAYSARIYNGKGEELAVTYFDAASKLETTYSEGTETMDIQRIPIEIVTKFPDGAAKIAIMKGTQEIYSRNVSKAAPTVSFTGLAAGQEIPNKTTINWKASGGGGDVYFDLYYCPGEGDFRQVASGITSSSYDVDLSGYPGSNEGYFYIYATDGVMTSESKSPLVKVPFKAPVFTTMQKEIPKFRMTDEILFKVDIYDMQDGWYEGWSGGAGKPEWKIDGKEYLPMKDLWLWPYMLSPRVHTVTCTVTNTAGLSTSQDFQIEVTGDESGLPNDWARNDIINALKCGYAVSLERIDAPISRLEFADLMLILFSYVKPRDYQVAPDAFDITDVGDDELSPWLMVGLGVMDAPDGLFRPSQSLTEREAMEIIYRVIAIGEDPDVTEEEFFSEPEYIERFVDKGVLDEAGPNVYSPDERLSKRMALVRLSRFMGEQDITSPYAG